MNQKVWIIDDQGWKGSPGKSPMEDPSPTKAKRNTDSRPLPAPAQKNPALSFSLSMFIWGGGQMYGGDYRAGLVLLAFMVFFYSAISAAVFSRHSLGRFVAGSNTPAPELVVGAAVFFLIGLVVWIGNAVDAYYRTERSRSEAFLGVDNELCPLLCSVLFPGWGQFLNGQPKKGVFFLLFGVAGTFSVFISSVAGYFWPVLEGSPGRSVIETGLAAAFLLLPVCALMWIISAYDSFRSCRQLFIEKLRSQQAGFRVRSRGGLRGFLPRGTAILGLLLAISVGMQLIPREYYLDTLERIRAAMLDRHMEILPELLRKAITFIGR